MTTPLKEYDSVVDLMAQRLYELLQQKSGEQVLFLHSSWGELDHLIAQVYCEVVLQLIADARAEKENWTREYLASEAARIRDAMERPEELQGQMRQIAANFPEIRSMESLGNRMLLVGRGERHNPDERVSHMVESGQVVIIKNIES